MTDVRSMSDCPPRDPLGALVDLLAAYDRANRLQIDAMYARLSPTLDDYYVEDLRLEFPASAAVLPRRPEVRPEIILTRTVPGVAVRTVQGPGAPFPLARAAALVRAALAGGGNEGQRWLRRLEGGQARLVVRQLGRTQAAYLAIEPDGGEVMRLLAGLAGAGP